MAGQWSPTEFLRCPFCRRSGTTELRIQEAGDVILACTACAAYTLAEAEEDGEAVYSDQSPLSREERSDE